MRFEATTPAPGNFANAPWPDGPPPSYFPPVPPAVDLRRVHVEDREEFELLARISYAATLGRRQVTVTVPQADGRFTTDLTSVPRWFTWLVPKSGAHLPAALVHDGLVLDDPAVVTYETSDGEPIDRIDADLVFRDAMRDTRVGLVRRWVVWSAVTIASLVVGPRPAERWPLWCRLYYWLVVAATFGLVLYLGACATADLADVRVRGLWDLPWMHRSLAGELVGGLAGAVVVPTAMSSAWGRWWRAGAIAGVALATLVHVTIGVGLVALGYQVAERVLGRPRLAPWLLVGALAVSLAVFARALA